MNKVVLQNTNLNFNVNIVSVDEQNNGTALPIDMGSIVNFEIDENLIDVGITGSITYVSWFQITEKLGISEGSGRDTLYITVDIQSIDNNDSEDDTRGISFIGLMESSKAGGNVASGQQTYRFEEVLTTRLKKQSLKNLKQPFTQDGSISDIIRSILDATKTPHDFTVNDESSTNITNFLQFEDSIYLTIRKLYNAMRVKISGGQGLALMKTENVNGERCVQVRDMFTTKHLQFLTDYIAGAGSGIDYSDVYQEEFIFSPGESESANSSLYNNVEEFNHVKRDIGELRQTVWGAYKLSGWASDESSDEGAPADPTNVATEFEKFNDILIGFEQYIKNFSNIPYIDEEEVKVFEIDALSDNPTDTDIIRDIVYNRVWKSFIFRNETLVLKVKGNTYRKPGMFISVRGSGFNKKGIPATELWFVIKNKHMFTDGLYENEITAVRFLSDKQLADFIRSAGNFFADVAGGIGDAFGNLTDRLGEIPENAKEFFSDYPDADEIPDPEELFGPDNYTTPVGKLSKDWEDLEEDQWNAKIKQQMKDQLAAEARGLEVKDATPEEIEAFFDELEK